MSLATTRRAFLAGVAALLSAPVRAAIPRSPEVAPGPRRWLWVHASKFVRDASCTKVCMTVTAQRSDGEFFYVTVVEYQEDLDAADPVAVRELLDLDIQNAYVTLNDFLNCSCTVRQACTRHYVEPPTEAELAAMREEFDL